MRCSPSCALRRVASQRTPLATLSGAPLVTAARMGSPSIIKQQLHSTRSYAVVFVITAIINISFNLILPALIGFAMADSFALGALSANSQMRF